MSLFAYEDEPLKALCEELDQWKRKLDFQGVLPRRWAGRLRRDLEAEAVAASTSMEGVPVTVEEVRRILAGEAPADVRKEDRELVEGYRDAMSYVLRRADDPGFRWDRELVVGLHDRILAGSHALSAGRIRTDRPTFIVSSLTGKQVFLPPPGEEVLGLVDEACRIMEELPAHPAVAAAWIHVTVAAIHPFKDGNGRAARVLASLAMYRGGFKRREFTSLEEWWGRHLADYYEAFVCLGGEFDASADVTPFLEAHIKAQLHQIRALANREKVEREIWTALEEVSEDASLDPRVANALWDAFFERDVTAGYYRSLTDISAATATKDLAAATSAGLLQPVGQRRGRRYLPTEALHMAVGRAFLIELSGPVDVLRAGIISELSRRLTWTGEALGLQSVD
jgi:Fic family protein